MPLPEGLAGRLLAASLLVLIGTACAAGPAAREPQLTHPPRYQQWFGAEPSEAEAKEAEDSEAEDSEFFGASYSGSFRLPLSEDWHWQMPDPGHWSISRLELAPAVVHGDVVLVGNSRSTGLFVLDRYTGRHLRTVAMDGPVQAAPVRLEDGWLIADVFGNLQRFDDEFAPLWPQPYSIGGAVYRAPVRDGDQVLVATGNDLVVSVALEDGRWRWNHKRSVARNDTELAILGAPSPVVVGDEVLQGFSDGYLVAIDRNNGAELWAVQVGDGKFPDIQSEVVVHEGLFITAAFGGPVVAVDARNHQVRWRNDTAGAVSSMVLSDESLYTADASGRLHAVNPATGESQWQWEPRETQLGPPIRVGAALIVGDASGTVYGVDRYEGKELWRYRPSDGSRPAGVSAAAVVQGRQLVFSTAGGTVHSLISASARATDLSEEPGHRRDRVIGW